MILPAALLLLFASQAAGDDLGALHAACFEKQDAAACDRVTALYRAGREAACSGPDATDERCQALCQGATSPPGACVSWAQRLERLGHPGDPNPWLQKACDRGDGAACCLLGTRYQMGQHSPKSPERVGPLVQRACALHVAACCGMWGLLQFTGPEVAHKDRLVGVAAFGEGCEGGFAPACSYLAQAYENGDAVPRSEPQAAEYYQRACDGQYFKACFVLGDLYDRGKDLPGDKARAVGLFHLACGGGLGEACARVKALQAKAPVDLRLQTEGAASERLKQALQPVLQQARRTYPSAKARFLAGLPKGRTFYVTVWLHDPDGRKEQTFLKVLGIAEGHVEGELASDVLSLTHYRRGQRLTVLESEVKDWTIIHPDVTEEGNAVGKFLDTYREK